MRVEVLTITFKGPAYPEPIWPILHLCPLYTVQVTLVPCFPWTGQLRAFVLTLHSIRTNIPNIISFISLRHHLNCHIFLVFPEHSTVHIKISPYSLSPILLFSLFTELAIPANSNSISLLIFSSMTGIWGLREERHYLCSCFFLLVSELFWP